MVWNAERGSKEFMSGLISGLAGLSSSMSTQLCDL